MRTKSTEQQGGPKTVDVKAAVESRRHDGIDLVFEQDELAAHHRLLMYGWCKRRPGSRCWRTRETLSAYLNADVVPGECKLVRTLLRNIHALGAQRPIQRRAGLLRHR